MSLAVTYAPHSDARLMDLQWNPGFPHLLLTVLSTGVVSLLEVTDKVTVVVKKDGLLANCGEKYLLSQPMLEGFKNYIFLPLILYCINSVL